MGRSKERSKPISSLFKGDARKVGASLSLKLSTNREG